MFIPNVWNADLTAAGLEGSKFAPIIAGDDWTGDFTVLDSSGTVVDLTGALVLMTVRDKVGGSILLTRRSDTNITGSSPARKQIAIASDATTGIFTLRFGREASEVTLLEGIAGRVRIFDIRIVFADGTVETFLRGRIDFTVTVTDPAR